MKQLLLAIALTVPLITHAKEWASKPLEITEPQLISCNARFDGYGTKSNERVRLTIKFNADELGVIEHVGEHEIVRSYKNPKLFIDFLGGYKITAYQYEKAFNDKSKVSPIYREVFINTSDMGSKFVTYSTILKSRFKQTGDEWFTDYVSQEKYIDCHSTLPKI
ncbi:hypothetical protein KW462_07910 [Vibrio fluvialis]|nr:hypothetical protein [Vibrio fluvialis]